MLVVSRRSDEAIVIKLADGANGNLTLNDLFAKGPIEITLLGGNGRRVKMGIAAPPELCIGAKIRRSSLRLRPGALRPLFLIENSPNLPCRRSARRAT